MAIRNCRDLLAWQKAMALVEGVYRITSELPTDERFGLMVQMRRAAVSIPSNIAEGEGRRTNGEYLNQLSVAHGSIRELETHLLLAERLGMLSRDVWRPASFRQRKLAGSSRVWRTRSPPGVEPVAGRFRSACRIDRCRPPGTSSCRPLPTADCQLPTT
jgi:four helix bundle protein